MTAEEHLRTIIGDLVLRIAQLAAEVDSCKVQLAGRDPEASVHLSPELAAQGGEAMTDRAKVKDAADSQRVKRGPEERRG